MRDAASALLHDGPELEDLVAEIRDMRNGRKRIAIAIPTRNWNEILSEHLKRLSAQTFRDFDVIIVYGEDDEYLDDVCGLQVVHIRRKSDCGSAGGFYIGEKFAFDEGYDRVILADNDALPDSGSLVLELVRAVDSGADIALPKVRNKKGGEARTIDIIAQYGCMSSAMLKKAGLTFFPFYFGGEDIEHLERMRRHGAKIAYVESCALHPPASASMFIVKPSKKLHHLRGLILFSYLGKSVIDVYCEIFMLLVYGLFLLPWRAGIFRGMCGAACHASQMHFFRLKTSAEDDVSPAPVNGAEGFGAISLMAGFYQGRTVLEKAGSAFRSLMRYLAQMPRIFGRSIVFDGAVGHDGIALAILAKNSYLKYDGKIFPVFKENRFYLFPIFFLYFPLVVFLSVFLAVALGTFGYLRMYMLGVRTEGYGVRKQEK
jgi:GT2 family glycosyltransferase